MYVEQLSTTALANIKLALYLIGKLCKILYDYMKQ